MGSIFCLSNQSEARGILERFFIAGENTKISKNRTFLHSWNQYWQLDFCKTLGCSVLENGNCGQKSEIKPRIHFESDFSSRYPESLFLFPIFYPGNFVLNRLKKRKMDVWGRDAMIGQKSTLRDNLFQPIIVFC